jgi:REP element-mobilizing transposase RayT
MARNLRLASDSGVYHVILRGVNRQDIFESEKDYLKFLSLLERVVFPVDETGQRIPPLLVIYAYCLMPNHVHLLVREQKCGVSAAIKWISGTYAGYFNQKYEHIGHLFQDRFRSEVVNDWEYFLNLMRYIHQNPVAGGLVNDVRHYRWSSWREFDPGMVCDVPMCATQAVFTKISFDALEELVDTPLPKTQRILDFDSDSGRRVTDERVREYIKAEFGIAEVSTIQHLAKAERNEVIKKLLEFCRNVRQISRVTGISRGVIHRLDK